MRSSFYTREQLEALPLARLRLIDVRDKEEEDLLQEVINLKILHTPEPTPVDRTGINTDIRTKEQEDAAQAEIDKRTKANRKKMTGGISEEPVAPSAGPVSEESAPVEPVKAKKSKKAKTE